MKTLRLVLLFLSLVSAQLLSAQDKKWTLEECIDYALKNNVNVLQAGLGAKIAANENLQSKLNLLPNIDANASYNFNYGNSLNPVSFQFVEMNSQSGSLSLQGTLPLFTGLQQMHNIQRTKYELQASKFDYEAAQNNLALAVSSAFLQILLNKEIVNVLQKQKDLTASQRVSVESRVRTGVLPENVLLETDAQLARDEANLVSAKGVSDVSVLTLKQLLQLSGDEGFDVVMPNVDADALAGIGSVTSKSVFDYAVTNQPSIKGAEARVMSADASRKIAYGALSPTLSAFTALSTGYFSQDQRVTRYDTLEFGGVKIPTPAEYTRVPFGDQLDNNFRKVVGFQLNIPIFGRGQRFTTISNSRLQLQIRKLQLEAARNTLRQDIEQAYANARVAAESYIANKKGFEAAQKSFDVLNKRYQSGLSNNFELQQSKNTLSAAEAEMAKAKYTYVFRLKVLDFYQGKKITLN